MSTRTQLAWANIALIFVVWVILLSDRLGLPFPLLLAAWTLEIVLFVFIHSLRKELKEEAAVPGENTILTPTAARNRIIVLGIIPVTALISLYTLPLLNPGLPLRLSIYAGLTMGVIGSVAALWRLRRSGIRLSDHKPISILLCLLVLSLMQHNVTVLLRSHAIARISLSLDVANAERLARGQTVESAEEFIAQIQGIDTGFAPPDFKQAFGDYQKSYSELLQAVKVRERTKAIAAQASMEAALVKLVAIAKKY